MAPQITAERSDDFSEAYANNILYEASAWDLKLIFGQLDQRDNANPKVELHTAITIPWPLVRLMIYWLRGQVEAHELANGRIHVPKGVIPPELPPMTDELKKTDVNAEAVWGIFTRLRREFIESLK